MWAAGFCLLLHLQSPGPVSGPAVVNLSYEAARRVMQEMQEALPPELQGKSPEAQSSAWPRWLADFNSQVRARLTRGDEDTLVNFLLFGVSYTNQPRLAAHLNPDPASSQPEYQRRQQPILQARMDDLARALADPKDNDRLLFFRSLVMRQNLKPGDAADAEKLRSFLSANVARVRTESSAYTAALAEARQLGNASEEFAQRSTLFHDRGLSLDTTLLPNFAVEQSLRAMKNQELLATGRIQRVAVIGPGLDFTDKDAGYDFYPVQTIQPFALVDSLSRLGLAAPGGLEVTTLDVSPRVNDHLNRSRQRALKGISYTVQLPRDSHAPWKADYLRYWENFGDHIGSAAPPAKIPVAAAGLVTRAVRIRADLVARVRPVDLNIVTQHLQLPAAESFDLIIATNVFVYYDVFQQCLALLNVESMLRPGGFLLSNNALLELPDSKIHSVGYQTTVYSDRPGDGDHVVWYLRLPD